MTTTQTVPAALYSCCEAAPAAVATDATGREVSVCASCAPVAARGGFTVTAAPAPKRARSTFTLAGVVHATARAENGRRFVYRTARCGKYDNGRATAATRDAVVTCPACAAGMRR